VNEQSQIPEIPNSNSSILKTIFLTLLVSSLIFGGGVYVFQRSELVSLNTEIENLRLEVAELQSQTDEETLNSPVDNLELQGQRRLTTGLYLRGIPVDIYLEQYGEASEGRIVVSHAWNRITDRNEGAFVVRSENDGPCLTQLKPITNYNGVRFVTEYICGDTQFLTVTSFSYENSSSTDIKSVSADNVTELNLNDYFSSVYMRSFIEIIGWQDFDHLLVNQIIYTDLENGTDKRKQELYLFNVITKEKQLIHMIE
jgi:hypothetical protein